MKLHKRTLCAVLLMCMLWGQMAPMHVQAASTDYLDKPVSNVGGQWSDLFNGVSTGSYTDNIKDLDLESDLSNINLHANNYSDRFIGLCVLALNNEDVLNDSNGNPNPFSGVIDLSMSSDKFEDYHDKTSVTIGGNKVSFDLSTVVPAKFLSGDHFKVVYTNVDTDKNLTAKYRALSRTAVEYIYYADTWRKEVNDYMSKHDGVMLNTHAQILNQLHEVAIFCGNGNYNSKGEKVQSSNKIPFQFIVDLYFAQGSSSSLGLHELWEYSQDMRNIQTDSAYGDVVLEATQPLVNFYKVNNDTGLTWADTVSMTKVLDTKTNADDDSVENTQDPSMTTTSDTISAVSTAERNYVTIGEQIVKGVAYSAGYIPMQTNLYSTAVVNGYDTQWLTDWHYKYGFMRKALLRDKSATSAMDYYNSLGINKGDLEVCTLRDFLELGDRDLTLYIDDSFYNSDTAKDIWFSTVDEDSANLDEFIEDLDAYLKQSYGKDETESDYESIDAEFINDTYAYDLTGSTEEDVKDLLSDLKRQRKASSANVEFEAIVKTDSYNQYSNKVRKELIDADGDYYSNADSETFGMDNYDSVVMSSSTINDTLDCITVRTETGAETTMTDYEYTTYDEYTPMLSYAYVSAIYRDKSAYKVATLNELGTPVFIASDDVAQVRDATLYDRSSLLNYMLVRNLNSMVQINYTYSMDMDSPVYMDIYGNIISESGLVIIPAACNATLYPDDYCNYMYAIGLFTCYGNEYFVPGDFEYVEDLLSPFFRLDTANNVWIIDGKGVQVNSTVVDFANIEAYVHTTQEAMFEAFTSYVYSEDTSGKHENTHLLWTKWVDIINEVMRGAPLEHINKEVEGLSTTGNVNKSSIVAAAKLEGLIDSLKGATSNTLLNIPDFSTMEHSEYVVAFLFKIILVITTVVIIIHIYQDASAGILGLRTLLKSGGAVALTFIAITLIPALFQLTYYGANKLLLQNEVTKICMYNLEKSQSGIEIGVTDTNVPDTHNKIMVQLDWIDVPWYNEIYELLFGESLEAVSIAREEAQQSSIIANMSDVQFYNDGVYMDVEEIFNSVGMDYTFNVGEMEEGSTEANGLYLYNNDASNQSLSFYSPYYAFLTALTANVNGYNDSHNCYMYTTKMQSGNRLKTVGLCSQYFQSESFMELDPDILHLYEIYGISKEAWYDTGSVFYTDEVDLMHKSTWYNDIVAYDQEEAKKRIDIVNGYCRDFVAENRDLLDKVTDETFIKVMALSMALKYNQAFGITEASCFEIYNLDSNDLLRLSLAKTNDAMLTSPMSFSRFVLSLGGEASVYSAAILEMVMFLGSFIKPICVILAYVVVFLSIFINKVVLRNKNQSLLGYCTTILLLSATNFLHAVILKVSTYLPGIGISMLGCIIAIIIFQILYLLVLSYVVAVAMKDWRNLGADKYAETAESIKYKFSKKDARHLSANIARHDNNWDYYDDLVSQHRERNNNL